MIYQQSVFEPWPIESESVQAVITSPPYYALRKYNIPNIKIGAWQGQYGLEPTPQMYVEHTLLWAKEAWRVLRNDGIIALVDDGWTLRNTIIWYKTNAMPESVTDRFSKKYEYIFMFTKSPDYYFNLDSTREPHKEISKERIKHPFNPTKVEGRAINNEGDMARFCHPLGKNPGDVWTIPTQPSSEKHFAMWPERLVERMIKCSTKAGDTVLDCFAGSGTTLKVAEELHRKGIGIDLGYQEISKRRTGKIQKRLF